MKVTMFQSTDGKLHPTKLECLQQDAQLQAKTLIKALVIEHSKVDGKAGFEDIADDVTEMIFTNSRGFFSILAPMQPPKAREPRKTKGEAKSPADAAALAAAAVATAVVV